MPDLATFIKSARMVVAQNEGVVRGNVSCNGVVCSECPASMRFNGGRSLCKKEFFTQYLADNAPFPAIPIERFEVGHWYVYTGKEQLGNWESTGKMDFVLDGKPHQCRKTGSSPYWADFVDHPRGDADTWSWSEGLENWREVPAPAEVRTSEVFMPSSAIDVSGDYPADKIPEFVAMAKKIISSGNCRAFPSSECAVCPARSSYHDGGSCSDVTGGSNIDGTKASQAWFRAFVDRYGPETEVRTSNVINVDVAALQRPFFDAIMAGMARMKVASTPWSTRDHFQDNMQPDRAALRKWHLEDM